ncbi:MAG TPA: universal stress protein [Trebonia sp.]|nr:universal stress protein [Trebonia sp.]
MSGIFVGVDGSDHSRLALGWALREAARHRAPLTVMSVRPHPVRPATEIYWAVPDLPVDPREEETELKALQEFVGTVKSETGEDVADISLVMETGDPAEELISASRDADLLVIGSRGNGGFARLLLGSVSSKVVHHAACPVVVIR